MVPFTLRHLMRFVPRLHTIFMVTSDDLQARGIVNFANRNFGGSNALPHVELHDEQRFVVTPARLKEHLLAVHSWNGTLRSRFGGWTDRSGWYLQQFLKLYAAISIPTIRDYLVVDADVVFYHPYDVVAGAHAYWYMPNVLGACSQTQWAYTHTLERFIGDDVRLSRLQPRQGPCAISHHMVFKKDVLTSLHFDFDRLAHRDPSAHGEWWRALLNQISTSVEASFSEYMTYMAYAQAFYPHTVRWRTQTQFTRSGAVFKDCLEHAAQTNSTAFCMRPIEKTPSARNFTFVAYHRASRSFTLGLSPRVGSTLLAHTSD